MSTIREQDEMLVQNEVERRFLHATEEQRQSMLYDVGMREKYVLGRLLKHGVEKDEATRVMKHSAWHSNLTDLTLGYYSKDPVELWRVFCEELKERGAGYEWLDGELGKA